MPQTKQINIAWIGEIPEDWEVRKLKFALSKIESGGRDSGGGQDLKNGIFSIGGEHIGRNGELLLSNQRYISFEYYEKMNQGKVCSNDVLLVKDGATIGKTVFIGNIPNDKFAVNEHVFILRNNRKVNSKFLFYYIFSPLGQEQISLEIKGSAQPGLNSQFINNVFIPLPPLHVQQNIVNYLDQKSEQIKKFVEDKQKMIELLKEQKQTIIHDAVTKGIEKNKPMKDSGISWIGEIPEDWEVRKLKFVGEAIIGLTYNPKDITEKGDGTLVLRSSNIQNGKIVFDDNVFVNIDIPEKLKTKKGDILICSRNGSIDLIGKNAIIDDHSSNMSFGAFMTIFRTNYSQYMHYFFNSNLFSSQSSLFLTSTINQITSSVLNNMFVALPPLHTQQAIVSYLDQQTTKIDEAISKIQKEIELVEEYKKSLIYFVVTGKIQINQTNHAN